MDQKRHEVIAKWERRWLALSGLLSLLFVLLIAYTLATEGNHVAQRSGRAAPEVLLTNDIFAAPGVRATGPNSFQVSVVAKAFNFDPAEIRLPVGAEVDFFMISSDVIHGFQVENTSINVEMIPGDVAALSYTFDQEGHFRISCNEYCGISHHNMLGEIVVLPAAQYAQEASGADLVGQAADGEDAAALGEGVYAANCAGCHQVNGAGLSGAFPPLAGGHAPSLLAADRDYLPTVLLYGLQGAIEVDGTSYNGPMPAWSQLGDDELAAVTNYILTAWDNDQALPDPFVPYRAEEFDALRGQGLSTDDVYERRQALELGE